MSITIVCSCGKKLHAPQSLAGKKARCPGCGKVLNVPSLAASPLQDEMPIVIEPVSKSPAAPPAAAAPAIKPLEKTPVKPVEIKQPENKPAPDVSPVSTQKPLTIDPSSSEDPYELAIELAAAPVTAPVIRRGAQLQSNQPSEPQPTSETDHEKITGKKCEGCGAPMAADEVRCPRCSFDPSKSSYKDFLRERAMRGNRYENTDKTKSFGNFMGIELTPAALATAAVCFLAVVGIILWWFTGPGRNFNLVSSEPVLAIFPLPAIDDQTNASTPSILAPGTIIPGKLANKGNAPPTEILAVGGADSLVLAQPDPAGEHLLVECEISQRLLEEEKLEERYDLLVHGNNITIEGPGGPLPGTIILSKLTNGLTVGLITSRASETKLLWPANYKPTFNESTRGHGLATWNGTNGLKGEIKYTNIQESSRGDSPATGFIADGQLQLLDRKTQVDYKYTGGMVTMTWNQQHTGYHGSQAWRSKTDISPYHKFAFTILFPRVPAGTPNADKGDYRIKVGGRIVGQLDAGDVVAPPKSTGSTGPTAYKSGDPLTQYLSSLAVAKSRATGIVSMSNLQQLAEGILLYAQSNGGKMPASIQELEQSMGGFQQLMMNPRTKENPGFLYVCPAPQFGQITHPEKTVILYELFEGKPDRNGQVAYADGHVGAHP